jgi:hypothetical protein
MLSWLERRFSVREAGSDGKTEILAGITTFMTMAYIIFVNPSILSNTGMPFGPLMVATCLASALATLCMAFLANYPIALAPAWDLNAFFAFGSGARHGHLLGGGAGGDLPRRGALHPSHHDPPAGEHRQRPSQVPEDRHLRGDRALHRLPSAFRARGSS